MCKIMGTFFSDSTWISIQLIFCYQFLCLTVGIREMYNCTSSLLQGHPVYALFNKLLVWLFKEGFFPSPRCSSAVHSPFGVPLWHLPRAEDPNTVSQHRHNLVHDGMGMGLYTVSNNHSCWIFFNRLWCFLFIWCSTTMVAKMLLCKYDI